MMAKRSKMKSPVKLGAATKEMKVTEGETEDGGGERFYDAEESFQDLPRLTSESPRTVEDSIQHQAPVANIGNAPSIGTFDKEEYNARLRAYSEQVQQTPAVGKLRQPTTSGRHNNPHYKNPLIPANSTQRKLGPIVAARRSAYEVEEDSPVKGAAPPPQAQWTEARPQMSPRKADKRRAKKQKEAAAEVNTDAEAGAEDKQDETAAETNADVEAGAEDDGNDNIQVAEKPAGTAREEESATAPATADVAIPKKTRGRPTKAFVATETSLPPSKRVGRPKKSSNETDEVQADQTRPLRPSQILAAAEDMNKPSDEPKRSTRNEAAQEQVAVASAPVQPDDQPRQTRSTPKKKGRLSAVEGLRKRARVQETVNVQEGAEVKGDEAQANNVNNNSLFVSEDGPGNAQEVDHVRLSQMNFSDDDNDEDGEPSLPANPMLAKNKRKASSQAARPNTSRKRAKFGRSSDVDNLQDSESNGDPQRRRLYGQWKAFTEVLKKANNIGRGVRDGLPGDRFLVSNRDVGVRKTVRLCDTTLQIYDTLRTQEGPMQPEQDPVDLLDQIKERVDRLRGRDEDHPTDWENDTRATELYYHLIPKLIHVVKAAIVCYEAIDVGTAEGGQITIGHVRTVRLLIQILVELAKSSERYARPPTDLHVVQPVREIAPILRRIHSALSQQIYNYDLDERTAERQEEERQERLAQEQENVRQAQQNAITSRFRNKWQKLHDERMRAEGGLMRPTKRQYLAIPDETYYHEFDSNGIPFSREELFAPRIGPPPALINAAMSKEWSQVELMALGDGLKDYAGENVFERIFRKYCGPGWDLNKYSVTEIVVTAAWARERLIKDRKDKRWDVEDWILAIPVWTRSHFGEGQENEEEAEVDVDVTMSGALVD